MKESRFIDCVFIPGNFSGVEKALNEAGFFVRDFYPHPLDARVTCADIFGDNSQRAKMYAALKTLEENKQ